MSDRDLTRAIVPQRQRSPIRFCAYCAAPCVGYACQAHSDLPRLEPYRLADNPAPKEDGHA